MKANDSQYGEGRQWERDYRLSEGVRLPQIMIFKSAPGWAEESEVMRAFDRFGSRFYLLPASISSLAISSSNILKQLIYKLRS